MVQPLPVEFYSDFLSDLAKSRKPCPIRRLFPLEQRPGIISMFAGKPNAGTFPLTSLTIKSRSPFDSSSEIETEISGAALAEGMQYGPTAGLPSLIEWLYGFQEREHGRKKGEGWRLTIGAGSQDLLHKAIFALVNPGEAVLVESPTYASILPTLESLHCELVPIPTDANGIDSDLLRSTLENWPVFKPKPKIFYTVPYGGNPTGMTASTERRKAVLALAREHNFLILEDDPYYYVYFGDAPRPPSYFTLEQAEPEVGRVVRFDSMSKILSAGIRIGYACGPLPIMAAIDVHTEVASLMSPLLTQTIVFALLNEWGYDAFKAHTLAVSSFYREKRDVFERLMQQHLTGLVEWVSPEAGLFFWFKLLLPATDGEGEADSESIIRGPALEKGVIALPGTVCLPFGGKTPYVRAAFGLLEEAQVDEALKRLREVILEARGA